jgi:hypothetical protein
MRRPTDCRVFTRTAGFRSSLFFAFLLGAVLVLMASGLLARQGKLTTFNSSCVWSTPKTATPQLLEL